MNQSDFVLDASLGKLRGKLTGNINKPHAILLCMHGSPNGNLGGNEGVFDEIANYSDKLNICTAQFSFCGSLPSDGKPEQMSLQTQGYDYKSVFEYLDKRFLAPIIVVGESAGGTIATQHYDLPAHAYGLFWCAFDLSKSDLQPYLSKEWLELAKLNGEIRDGEICLGNDFLTELIETNFEPAFNLPEKACFLAHGKRDQEVPYQQSIDAILNARGEIVFLSHPMAGHGFKHPMHRKILHKHFRNWLISIILEMH